jgi:hypothetical protein
MEAGIPPSKPVKADAYFNDELDVVLVSVLADCLKGKILVFPDQRLCSSIHVARRRCLISSHDDLFYIVCPHIGRIQVSRKRKRGCI